MYGEIIRAYPFFESKNKTPFSLEAAEERNTLMKESNVVSLENPEQSFDHVFDEIVRNGARKMLQEAIQIEVDLFIQKKTSERTLEGHQKIVRNGYQPAREILSGAGKLKIRQPRLRYREDPSEKFTSSILPRYMRRSPSLDALIPALYLRGVSSGNFSGALEAILGRKVKGMSSNTVVRLKEKWAKEYGQWGHRDLSNKQYIYWWADGIHFNVRLEEQRTCILVVIGVLEDGTKELVAVADGYRESTESWLELLRNLKSQGLSEGPQLAVGDGALGFWAAIKDIYPQVRPQRCWVHKTANVLDKMPKSIQPNAKSLIHEIYLSPTCEKAQKALDYFLNRYQSKYPKACECLKKDQQSLLNFYDFPAEHWPHLRTTNPIESTFATVRLRTARTKGCGSRRATLTMVFKLAQEAQKTWRRLKGSNRIAQVIAGVKFIDGIEETKTEIAA